jgi:hypothetical protein
MSRPQNPFLEIYRGDSVNPDEYVRMFSPVLLEEADIASLYQPGNVILAGLAGAGKSILLNLLKPETLIAYFRANEKWPLPAHCAKFISAGINLEKSGAHEFAQRAGDDRSDEAITNLAVYFSDFINYWLVDDLLKSIETLISTDISGVKEHLGLSANHGSLDKFARELARNKCWFGALNEVENYTQLREVLEKRVVDYRRYLNYNTNELDDYINRSKTSVGEPISVTAELLKKAGVIPSGVPVFIRIDQMEELLGDQSAKTRLLAAYRRVIYRMVGSRDDRLSYRLGIRSYTLMTDRRMLGTQSKIEELRNFKSIDLNEILRRKEHSRGLFKPFAEDVFERRLRSAGYEIPVRMKKTMRYVFGSRPSPEERARIYANNSGEGVVIPEPDWPQGAAEFLIGLAVHNPLSAKLGEVWLRQNLEKREVKLSEITVSPWESPQKRWWKKERIEQALLQIAAAKKQRMIWSGDEDILALSGVNILVFLSICQLVFSEYIRTEKKESYEIPKIHSRIIQNLGIQQASTDWVRKLRVEANGGDDRYRFIEVLGETLRVNMRNDSRMSYPGGNGFSLSERDLGNQQAIKLFLEQCAAYGALVQKPHTPKTSSRGSSHKWYLFPIFSPNFQVPVVHTKEPLYVDTNKVRSWLDKAKVHLAAPGDDSRL